MPLAAFGRLADRVAWPVAILLIAFGGWMLVRTNNPIWKP